MKLSEWKPVEAPHCKLAESPRWAHTHWFWLNIDGRRLYRTFEQSLVSSLAKPRIESLALDDDYGCVLPTTDAGVYRLFGRKAIVTLHWPTDAGSAPVFSHFATPPFDPQAYRYNDGRADPAGRALVSSLSDARQPGAKLYQHAGTKITPVVDNLIVGNGLAFSPDGTAMYLSDTRHRAIWRFDYDSQTGVATHKELIAEYKQNAARPDGATVASDGSYIVAIYEGYRLDRYHPNGNLIEQIELPLAKPTMPCFGGPGLDQLVVTSAPQSNDFPNQPGFEKTSLIAAHSDLSGVAEPLLPRAVCQTIDR